MVFLEAKVLGVPILSTDFGSAYEFVDETNILSPDDLPDRIAELSMSYFPSDIHVINKSQFNEYNDAIMTQLIRLFS